MQEGTGARQRHSRAVFGAVEAQKGRFGGLSVKQGGRGGREVLGMEPGFRQ